MHLTNECNMTQPIRFLPTTLAGLLSDSTAALAVFQSLTNVRQINANGYMGELQLQDQTGQAFLPALYTSKLQFDLRFHALNALANAVFVRLWEEYRKPARLTQSNYLEPSILLGLDKYSSTSGQAIFQYDFPTASINKWQSNSKTYWFGSMLRNALAHGQATPAMGRIHLYNQPDRGDKNFEILMDVGDFVKLIVNALATFNTKAGQYGGYQVLTAILVYYQTFDYSILNDTSLWQVPNDVDAAFFGYAAQT